MDCEKKIDLTMTPIIENRKHIRELIQSFARIDECFDAAYRDRTDAKVLKRLHSLCAFLEFLLSFPLQEKMTGLNGDMVLGRHQMERLRLLVPVSADSKEADLDYLRERLRDNLYEFLLRTDHCSREQLFTRGIHIPPIVNLSLFQVLQVVVFTMSECLKKIDSDDVLNAVTD
jgi:hypothetical protein